jgi:hypothetical protein
MAYVTTAASSAAAIATITADTDYKEQEGDCIGNDHPKMDVGQWCLKRCAVEGNSGESK